MVPQQEETLIKIANKAKAKESVEIARGQISIYIELRENKNDSGAPFSPQKIQL